MGEIMVLGRQTSESTQYGKQDFTVEPYENLDLGVQLEYAIQNIKGTYTEAELPELGDGEAIDTSIPADPNVKNYSYTVVDGDVYYRENSRMVKPELNATATERVKGMVELRDCVQKLIGQQMDGFVSDATIRETQRELNDLYDKFTAKHGLINSRGNALAFADDSSYRDHFGRLVIEPTEARIVEYIYESCLEGATPAEIAAALTEQGIKSPMGNDLWSAGTVRSILRNEKYCGDALMQKTYTKDFRTHKSVKNTDLNMYFKENHHTAIIKKEDWITVQKLLSERHSTAKQATLRRLSNHFVAYRVKDGLFKGYLIMDSRWSFMERQEFMKIVDEAQNTTK